MALASATANRADAPLGISRVLVVEAVEELRVTVAAAVVKGDFSSSCIRSIP